MPVQSELVVLLGRAELTYWNVQGVASYCHVRAAGKTVKDVAWWYRNANLECAAINGFFAFYDEMVDVWIDGEKQPRPT